MGANPPMVMEYKMPIPPKKRVLSSADVASLVDKLMAASELVERVYRNLEDFTLFRATITPHKLKSDCEKIRKVMNDSLYYAKRMERLLGDESNMNSDTIQSVHENGANGIPEKDKMSLDTNLGRLVKDGFLIPRFGLDKCLECIKAAKPKDESDWINESRANKCFGFRGSEANFLKSWMNMQFYHGSNVQVETYGILSYDSRRRAFKYGDLKNFASRYYALFYLWQVELFRKGKKAFVIDDGEKYLLRDN